MGYFDPMNLLEDKSPEEILMFREAELAHAEGHLACEANALDYGADE